MTAVFVPQTGEQGLCGFWPFAVWLDQRHGIRSLLLDPCGAGGSVCAEDRFRYDQVAQVGLAVRWLREHRADRVSIVGASLGGAVAVVAAAQLGPSVDAVINLSGPVQWPQLDVVRSARAVRSPALFAVAPDDPGVAAPEMRAALNSVPSPVKRFVLAPVGHGWGMLGFWDGQRFEPERLAELVAAWIKRPATA